MFLTAIIRKNLYKIGISLERYPNGPLKRRVMLINYFNINKIIDIGANTGQYVKNMRMIGYHGKFISFEPLSDAFYKLKKNCSRDYNWSVYNFAIGESDCTKEINISANSVSSSFNKMLPVHTKESPSSKYIKTEIVQVKKLDTIYDDIVDFNDNVYIKIDTQGYEMNVLKGAENSLNKVIGIQLEMSLSQTYENEPDFKEVLNFMENKGFMLFSIEPGYYNKKSGQLYQFDGIFFRKELNQK